VSLFVSVFQPRDILRWSSEADIFRQEFDAINRLLVKEHLQPLDLNAIPNHSVLPRFKASFPTSAFYALCEFYACIAAGLGFTLPYTPEQEEALASEVEEIATSLTNHLICHSDRDGYYLPRDFDELIFDASRQVTGEFLGSSPRLLKQLVNLAPHLQIKLEDEQLTEVELERIKMLCYDSENPFATLQMVWLALFECARVSVGTGAWVVFNPNFGLDSQRQTPNDNSFTFKRISRWTLEYSEGGQSLLLEVDPGDPNGVFLTGVKTWADRTLLSDTDKCRIYQNLQEAFKMTGSHNVVEYNPYLEYLQSVEYNVRLNEQGQFEVSDYQGRNKPLTRLLESIFDLDPDLSEVISWFEPKGEGFLTQSNGCWRLKRENYNEYFFDYDRDYSPFDLDVIDVWHYSDDFASEDGSWAGEKILGEKLRLLVAQARVLCDQHKNI
jgi:hypothetical protein